MTEGKSINHIKAEYQRHCFTKCSSNNKDIGKKYTSILKINWCKYNDLITREHGKPNPQILGLPHHPVYCNWTTTFLPAVMV